jgi:hypothetical protein
MGAAYPPGTAVPTYKTTRHYSPEDSPNRCGSDNLKRYVRRIFTTITICKINAIVSATHCVVK